MQISKRLRDGALFYYINKTLSFKNMYAIYKKWIQSMCFSNAHTVVHKAFTIVELLIVVVVIAILASITVVAYNGITNQAKETSLKSDLRNGASQLQMWRAEKDEYPLSIDSFGRAQDTTLQYSFSNTGRTFCLTATSATLKGKVFSVSENGLLKEGACAGHIASPAQSGDYLQTISTSNCSSARVMAVDARDNNTYWVQKLPDSRCWMLTNLSYSGGGLDTYGDTKALQYGASNSSLSTTLPMYYVPPDANPTVSPDKPSTSIDGGITNPQYGYLYNWCAATGVQISTVGCGSGSDLPAIAISICPAGWRLPTSNSSGEFATLMTGIGATSNTTGVANLNSVWLGQYSGYKIGTIGGSGASGRYWSATRNYTLGAYFLEFGTSYIIPSSYDGTNRGYSVRCIAI